MIKEFSFNFNELKIDKQRLIESLGLGEVLPEPFDSYLEDAFEFANSLDDIKAAYRVCDAECIKDDFKIIADGVDFNIGKTNFREIDGSERLAFFVCSAGKKISDKSQEMLQGDDPTKGFIFDTLGTFITEAAGDKMEEHLKEDVLLNGDKITNRYSPGYCQWHVSDQPKLFSLLPEKVCGVILTPSFLMHPIKSISGVIGIGKNVTYRNYMCDLCNSKGCVYRVVRKKSIS